MKLNPFAKNKPKTPEEMAPMRHSLAHLLAAAVIDLYPDAKRAIGPAIDNGFYFDFGNLEISDKDLPKIEKRMRKILPTWKKFERVDYTPEEAKAKYPNNPYKHELIDEFSVPGEKLSFYCSLASDKKPEESYEDLCRGGHVENMKDIVADGFKLDRMAGAYWRGDENNAMLTRIYGLSFESKERLEEYVEIREEAKKRDHKKLGAQLELFMYHESAPGMAYWLPKGMIVMNELVNFWRKEHEARGYHEISTPLLNKKELWETSGHWEFYKDDMFVADMGDDDIYGMKAMNCPNAMIVFDSKIRSYRDLPLRLSDTDVLHRYERSGTLNGLLRARSFRQDDSHNYVTEDQIEDEYGRILDIANRFYDIFDLNYSFRLGTRPEKFMGDVESWDKAEAALHRILESKAKGNYEVEEGDGAFYGPKIDIVMKDALGRAWQMGTIQLDFQQPKRFNLSYIDKDGSKKTPVVIHRVIYGALERFLGILIEHTAGALPIMLAPEQVRVLPITDTQIKYAQEVLAGLKEAGIRATADTSAESLGKKIREAKMQKIPYLLIIGEKEMKDKTITVESREDGNQGASKLTKFITQINKELP